MNFMATGRSQVRSVKCCVLFDPSDGAILHMHRVVTMEGAAETPDHLVEERTRQLAKGFGLDVASLELLHVDAKVINWREIYGRSRQALSDRGRTCQSHPIERAARDCRL